MYETEKKKIHKQITKVWQENDKAFEVAVDNIIVIDVVNNIVITGEDVDKNVVITDDNVDNNVAIIHVSREVAHIEKEIILDTSVSGDKVVITSVAQPITRDELLVPPSFSLDTSITYFNLAL